MLRHALNLLAATVVATAFASVAQAAPVSEVSCRGDGTRVALLIGNQSYTGTMQSLVNPQRDTAAFAHLLCQHGFSVYRHGDLDVRTFDTAIGAFAQAARGAKTTLVYYSGHGFALGRQNWIVPVDAEVRCEDVAASRTGDIPAAIERRLIDLDKHLLARLKTGGDQIVILDACRTDPVKGCRGVDALSFSKGLVRPPEGGARLLLFATQDGQVAFDDLRGSVTSPLMTALIKRLPDNPRRDWLDALSAVSLEVATLTRRAQQPSIEFNIKPNGCLAADCGIPPITPSSPQTNPCAAAEAHWKSAEAIGTRAVLEDHLSQFARCAFAALARARLDALAKTAAVPTVVPAPPSIVINALGIVADRIALMKRSSVQAKMGAAMNAGREPFDVAKAKAIFETYIDKANKLPAVFPEGSRSGGNTSALPAIWEKPAAWRDAVDKFGREASAALEATKDLESFKAQFAIVQRNCANCHESFRRKS